MVGERDRVDAHRREGPCVLDVLDALHDELARPLLLDPGEVLEGHRRVEHRVEELGDGPRPVAVGGEGERLGREKVEEPRRSCHKPGEGPPRELRWDHEPVALIAQTCACDGDVNGDDEGVVAGDGGALDERHRAFAVLPHVELEPVAPERVRGLYVLDGCRAEGGERERYAREPGRRRARDLSLGAHHPGEARWRDAKRKRDGVAEDRRRGVDLRDIAQYSRMELDVLEGGARSREADLGLGGTLGVVKGSLGRAPLRECAKVGDRECRPKTTGRRIQLRTFDTHQAREFANARKLAFHGVRSARRATRPRSTDRRRRVRGPVAPAPRAPRRR